MILLLIKVLNCHTGNFSYLSNENYYFYYYLSDIKQEEHHIYEEKNDVLKEFDEFEVKVKKYKDLERQRIKNLVVRL